MTISKKIMIIAIIILMTVSLASCQDKKTSNEDLTVFFYTSSNNSSSAATIIPPIIHFEYGETIVRPDDPISKGLTFGGWYKDRESTTPWDFENDVVTESTVLYAKWIPNILTITYVFDEAGGTFIDPMITEFSLVDVLLLPKADRLGSMFIGWIITPIDEYQVGDQIYKSTQDFNEDTTLYALFENKEYTVRFRSLLDGVSNPTMHTVEFAADIDFPILEDTATKHFVGWFSNDGSETGDWGYQYVNGEVFLGKAIEYNSELGEWEFIPQGITAYGKWEDK
ncbi:MAG TPA: InlB B-repeat-containing protein [Acholeplasmataceae bacterium]|nr:InlB B-repeat-containing protein [Acholeplasmataceae bacterium]